MAWDTGLKEGDRVQVHQLLLDEPCSDVEVLLNCIGTVVDPAVEDDFYDNGPVVKVLVDLDEYTDPLSGKRHEHGRFLFLPDELTKDL